MGASQSSSQHHPPSRALHVLRVTPASPASKTTIEPFFDFVVGFEGDALTHENTIDAAQLERIVEQHEGRTLNLLVWNSKSRVTRVVPIKPSRAWSQTSDTAIPQSGGPPPQPSLLGLSMRMCEPEHATENVWHVLDVLEGSPAESAGLVPMGDWILGWSGGVLSAENDFYDLVEAHIDKPLRVYVYSYDFDTLREVVLIPNRHWGGEGLLGCVFGFGLLHRIPPQPEDRVPGSTPIELQEAAGEYEEQELFVPADVHSDSQFSPNQLEEWRRQEQEKWNQETIAARTLYDHSQQDLQTARPQNADSSFTSPADQGFEHEHDHDHNHDHDHSHAIHTRHNHYTASLATPSRTPSFADSSRTPTRVSARPSMNGLLLAQGISRGLSAISDNSGSAVHSDEDEANDDADDDDGRTSVAGTETTSLGSLTSVE
ncbi:putative GRASP55/65 PDZ-like domain containing protein [Lyophyllum shimeji]|uniref:GRASP55/65 PDZ-like domain containing protein n=1 Tax=Lyophyllum shimeji TaxID=47721 RepID=A0A9P3UMD6_LYOSH|nr:putative GRASP55/65 PDZ-like domain containing protein [Lyophyllum shimeji]